MQDANIDTYLALAVDCLRKARNESADRWMYIAIANAWVRLADGATMDNALLAEHETEPEPAQSGGASFH